MIHGSEFKLLFSSFRQFLEGFFQHAPHCHDFIALSDGLNAIGRLTALPCLPYDFSNSVASDSLVQVMRTLVDYAANETLVYLAEITRCSLQETKAFWTSSQASSKLMPLIEFDCMFFVLRIHFLLSHSPSCQSRKLQYPVSCSCHLAYPSFPPL